MHYRVVAVEMSDYPCYTVLQKFSTISPSSGTSCSAESLDFFRENYLV